MKAKQDPKDEYSFLDIPDQKLPRRHRTATEVAKWEFPKWHIVWTLRYAVVVYIYYISSARCKMRQLCLCMKLTALWMTSVSWLLKLTILWYRIRVSLSHQHLFYVCDVVICIWIILFLWLRCSPTRQVCVITILMVVSCRRHCAMCDCSRSKYVSLFWVL
jgi:hypothetical protein